MTASKYIEGIEFADHVYGLDIATEFLRELATGGIAMGFVVPFSASRKGDLASMILHRGRPKGQGQDPSIVFGQDGHKNCGFVGRSRGRTAMSTVGDFGGKGIGSPSRPNAR